MYMAAWWKACWPDGSSSWFAEQKTDSAVVVASSRHGIGDNHVAASRHHYDYSDVSLVDESGKNWGPGSRGYTGRLSFS